MRSTLPVLCLVIAALAVANVLSFGFGRDQGIYAVVASEMLEGAAPYRDVWDFKPPGIFLVYAFAQLAFGAGVHAVRITEVLALLSLWPAFRILSRRFVGAAEPGAVGFALALLAYASLDFWHTAQPEGFGGVATVWAIVLATGESHRRLAWLSSGALYALAGAMKPTLAGGAAVSAGLAARARGSATPIAAFAAGGGLVCAALGLWLWAAGSLAAARETFGAFVPGYTALAHAGASPAWLAVQSLRIWLVDLFPLLTIGLIALAVLPPGMPREREGALHVLLVIGVQLVGVVLQGKLFLYHFGGVLLLTGLLAGWGFWKLARRVRAEGRLAVAALVLLVLVAQGVGRAGEFWRRAAARAVVGVSDREGFAPGLADARTGLELRDRLHSAEDVDAADDRRAAEWLRRNTRPEERVFVWGFEPVLYVLAERRPASRYVYNVPQRVGWRRDSARAGLMADLARTPPAALVVQRGDVFPWVTGDERDSEAVLADFPAFREWIAERYAKVATFGDLDVYRERRRSEAPR